MNIRKFTGQDVTSAVRQATGVMLTIPIDAAYYLPEGRGGLSVIIEECKVYQHKYAGDRADCDNFAMALSGLAGLIGRCNCFAFVNDPEFPVGSHAYNLGLYHEDGRVKVAAVEPQKPSALAIRNTRTIGFKATVVMG